MPNPTETLPALIEQARPRFQAIAASTPTGIPLNFEREANFACQILEANQFTRSIAEQCPASLVAAVEQIAAVGLSLNPVTHHAYLVPRKTRSGMRICLDIGAAGYVELARNAGVRDVFYGLVYEADEFALPSRHGESARHSFDPFTKDRGKMRGAYAQHVNTDGTFGPCVTMPVADIVKRMQSSDGWKAHHETKKATQCVWCQWPEEMALKTVLRYARRWWPQTPELVRAVTTLASQEDDGLPPESDEGVIETTGEWMPPPADHPLGVAATPTAAGPETITPEQAAELRASVENAGGPVDPETGDPCLIATILALYKCKTLHDLPADKLSEVRLRVSNYAAKRAAR